MMKNLSPFLWLRSSWPGKMRDTSERMSGAEMSPWPTRPFTSNSQQPPAWEREMYQNGDLLLVISSDDLVCMPVLCPGRHLQNPRIPLCLLSSFRWWATEHRGCWGLAMAPQFGTSLLQGKLERGAELEFPRLMYHTTVQSMTRSCHFMRKTQEQNAREKKERQKKKKREKRGDFQPASGRHLIPT